MPAPFTVRDQDDPGRDLGGWDENGNITLPGTITVATLAVTTSIVPAGAATQLAVPAAGFLIGGDVTLYRGTANELWTDDRLTVQGTGASSVCCAVRIAGESGPRFYTRGSGELQWGPNTGTPDTNLYRSAADVLSTDDSFTIGSNFRHFGVGVGFYGAVAGAMPTVTGSRDGNAALASLLTGLATLGLITDSSTA